MAQRACELGDQYPAYLTRGLQIQWCPFFPLKAVIGLMSAFHPYRTLASVD